MKKKHPHIGYLKVGDTIRTKYEGKVMKRTILDISIDPTWKPSGNVLIKVINQDGKEAVLGLENLVEWFGKATWEKVE